MPLKPQILSLIQSGQWPRAKTLCSQLCRDNAKDPEAWFLLAGINAQLGAMDEVIACCRKVAELQPNNIAAHYNLGVALQSQKRQEEAVAAYREVLNRDPNHALAHANLGLALRELGQVEEAISSCQQALRLQPMLVEAHNTLGLLLKDQGKFEEAAACFQQAITYRPGYAEACYNLGLCREAQGKLEEAANCYRQAIGLRSSYAEAHCHLGNILATQEKLDDAITHYRSAVEAKPDYAEAWNILGNALLDQEGLRKNYAEAERCFQNVLRFDPANIDVCYNLGITYQQQKKVNEALECFQKVAQLKPDHAGALLGLGSMFRKKGLLTDAEKMYREALRINPDFRSARYYLAMLGAEESPPQSPSEYIAGLFNSYADNFEHHLVAKLGYHVPEMLFNIVRSVAGRDDQKMDVVDLGCGTGLCGPLFRGVAHRLTGVDLSPKMLENARKKNVYDELVLTDVTTHLSSMESTYDLVIAADVFIYIGDLAKVFAVCKTALRPGGLFAFSTETTDKGNYVLGTTGRYAQSVEYIRGLAAETGLTEVIMEKTMLRYEMNDPISGNIFVLKKSETRSHQ